MACFEHPPTAAAEPGVSNDFTTDTGETTLLYHEQSWPAIRKIDKQTPVLVPLGSCEQHGLHLPLFVDSIQVTALAEAVEKEMADRLLLLPTLWLGSSHHHMDFPGTVSIPPSLYAQVIKSLAKCLIHHGFRRVVFFNGHGGNAVPLAEALSELVCESDDADDAHLVAATWWSVGQNGLDPERHQMTTAKLSHACEYETSLMMALRPDLVQTPANEDPTPVLKSEWFQFDGSARRVQAFRRFHRMTGTGAMGAPSKATADKGQSLFHAVVEETVRFLEEFQTWPELKPQEVEAYKASRRV